MDGLKDEIGILNLNNSKSNKIYDELKLKMNEEVNKSIYLTKFFLSSFKI
jgi:hypothetical protein